MVQMEIISPTGSGALPPVEWNYEQVKISLQEKLQSYQGRVYTPETITAAKADRATLNKLIAAIAAKRREIKAQYLKPYEQFEGQCKEIEAMVAQVSGAIDAQIKAEEQAEAAKKQAAIEELYRKAGGELCGVLPLDAIFSKKWLNKSYRLGAIEAELAATFARVEHDMDAIRSTCGRDVDACLDTYLHSGLDLPAAIAKHQALEDIREKQAAHFTGSDRFAELRASLTGESALQGPDSAPQAPQTPAEGKVTQPAPEASQAAAEPAWQSVAHYLDLRVYYTDAAQLKALRKYMVVNHIRFCRVPTDQ
ncbi:MAG: DUF1351 domain-containing protein [Gemmiger sp.]